MNDTNTASLSSVAEEWLVNIYQNKYRELRKYAASIIGDELEAERLVGTSLETLHLELRRSSMRLNSCSQANAFLVTVIRNRCISWLRKKRPAMVRNMTMDDAFAAIKDEHQFVIDLESREQLKYALSLVYLLPEKLQQVAVFIFVEGLTTKEIEKRTNLNHAVLHVYKNRIVKRLRELAAADYH